MNSTKNTSSAVIEYITQYCNSSSLSLAFLSRKLNKSENEISRMFFDLISSSHLASDELCKKLIKKHITEYETKHAIKNSSLRKIYKEALNNRQHNKKEEKELVTS